jgi:Xaa-Pro aminopeptidase
MLMPSARVKRVVERLEANELDALYVTSLPNIYYLTGFTGSTAQVLVSPRKRWFITDFRYHEQFGAQCDQDFELVDNTSRKFVDDILPSLGGDRLKRVGFESEHVSHAGFLKLSAASGIDFVATSAWIEDLRLIKDAGELARIREAVQLGERIFGELLGLIGPQTREADLAAELEYRARRYGAEECSFSPIIASGVNSSKPHAGFTKQMLTPAAPLTVDMGVKLNGYCSDMTRTVFYKDCPAQWRKVYNVVREAKRLAQAVVAPGMAGSAVDAVARQHITDAGYGEHFGHGLGHGVGIEVHEAPRLARTAENVLAVGEVGTNEPGIYLPGEGGVRIEDMFVVTADGSENLNVLGDEIQVVG